MSIRIPISVLFLSLILPAPAGTSNGYAAGYCTDWLRGAD